MAKVKISVKAAEDLDNIWLYTMKNWSVDQADRYVNSILDEIFFFCFKHSAGKDFNDVRKGYQYARIGSHTIFYKYIQSSDVVEIIRVLHQRMDLKKRMNDS